MRIFMIQLLFSVIEKAVTLNSDILINELNNVQGYQGVFGPVSVSDRNIKYLFSFRTWN